MFLLTHGITSVAARDPEQVAVRYLNRSLTYSELVERSDQVARLLIEEGVKRGDRVGLFMHKSIEAIIGLYGIMKAGAAYVPLDPLAPSARLVYVIRDCGIRCLISEEAKIDTLREIKDAPTDLECVIGLKARDNLPFRTLSWEDTFRASLPAPTVPVIGDDLCYILYTSGSTGKPKGIMHTHRSALAFAGWACREYGLTQRDRLSNHAPFHFDLSTFDLFSGAIAGATTVIIPEATTKFPASLSRLIESERISIWYSVPFALIQMLTRGALPSRDLSSLRWVLFAGEPFPTKHLRELMAQVPHARFSNLYGPTETNVCTYYHVPELPANSDEPIPIGRPCSDTEVLVVDDENRPVPDGDPGELIVRGASVMRGYWGRPDLTENGFYRRPAFSHYEDIFYRTGDLVRRDLDGNFEFLGRKDRQIKIRGYRVELDEIEVALLSHELVEEAAVYVVPEGDDSKRLEAAVLPKMGVQLTVSELRRHLNDRLPAYAVPAHLIIKEEFPRTSTGKINRRELQTLASTAEQQVHV